MNILSSKNPRLLELIFLIIVIFILSFMSFSVASLLSLGFIWNWTLLFEVEKVKTNKRYRFSTLKFVFILRDLFEKPLKAHPQYLWIARLFPAGLFWLLVGYFLDSYAYWWAPFVGSALLEGIHWIIQKRASA